MSVIARIADKTGALGSVLGMIGPAIVLAAMYLFFGRGWTENLFYAGLALMLGISIWDLVSPANRRCALDSCPTPQQH